jgi:hypothetical protein
MMIVDVRNHLKAKWPDTRFYISVKHRGSANGSDQLCVAWKTGPDWVQVERHLLMILAGDTKWDEFILRSCDTEDVEAYWATICLRHRKTMLQCETCRYDELYDREPTDDEKLAAIIFPDRFGPGAMR